MPLISDVTVSITASMEKFRQAIEKVRLQLVVMADAWHDAWLYSQPRYRQWWHFLWCKR